MQEPKLYKILIPFRYKIKDHIQWATIAMKPMELPLHAAQQLIRMGNVEEFIK